MSCEMEYFFSFDFTVSQVRISVSSIQGNIVSVSVELNTCLETLAYALSTGQLVVVETNILASGYVFFPDCAVKIISSALKASTDIITNMHSSSYRTRWDISINACLDFCRYSIFPDFAQCSQN